jgi:hypothetical protein
MDSTVYSGVPSTGTRVSGLALLKPQAIPWHIWSCVTASLSILIGLYWDVAWHATIGRDTFWTPAHLLIQFAALLTAVSSSFLIFKTTFWGDQVAKQSTVNVLGFRGPMGAFISAWGGVAMLTSAPFDNWWHEAYGLDVKIISPPHMLLALGIASILFGGVVQILGQLNNAEGSVHKRLQQLLLLSGGLLLALNMIIVLSESGRFFQHSPITYIAVGIGTPLLIEAISRGSGWRWARTAITSIYMALFLLGLWIFPLFPGEPKLGPVYWKVTHMVPLGFPLLLVVPAFVLDYLAPRMKIQNWGKWSQALFLGSLFLVAWMAVQWPFGSFLMSPASRNWFFGTIYRYYAVPPTALDARNIFYQATLRFWWIGIPSALIGAILSTRVGITFGNWMHEVRR